MKKLEVICVIPPVVLLSPGLVKGLKKICKANRINIEQVEGGFELSRDLDRVEELLISRAKDLQTSL